VTAMTVLVGTDLTFDDVIAVASRAVKVDIAAGVKERMDAARRVVEEAVANQETLYGVTTGFGGLSNVRIDPSEAERLQQDIVRSHATAVGPPLPEEVVRAMILLRARTFAFGISGVRFEIVERLVSFLNEGIHPHVPAQGSLGASGDLALLAHLALPLLGEGEVDVAGRRVPAADALADAGIEPILPSFKEGLSLVNGTEGMLALGILTCRTAERLARTSDLAGAMTLEACLGTDRAFDEELIRLRAHTGARESASNLRRLLSGSEIVASHRYSDHLVQDAYSLRCMPQVHGAYRDGIKYVRKILEAELASAVDNPSILVERGEVLSGGNFHGEALGLALDHLCVCLTGFATISERRVARLVDPDLNNGLPAFLTEDPGRRSGFMLAQYTAASLVSENRSLCFPASTDSIPTSAGQEDHVSMGMTSARRAAQILENSERVIAIELLAAAQGLDLRAPLSPAAGTAAALAALRVISPHLDEDRPLGGDIEAARRLMASDEMGRAIEGVA
jgi:histidine ammonia-lyase